MVDLPLQRSLKIGRAVVGLVGLDIALSRALAAAGRTPEQPSEQIVAQLYRQVAAENYIPPGKEELYRQALAGEYRRLRDGGRPAGGAPEIRILGPGCVSCNRLQELVFAVMAEMGVAADIIQLYDPDEIGRFGLNRTPALVVNGRVVCAGRLPSRAELVEWLQAAAPAPEDQP